MKSFLKYSKFGIGTLVIASAFMACDDDDEAVYKTPYTANTSNIKKAGNAVDLGLSVKWADMNVGAASEADNGILFSWGDITGTSLEEGAYSVMLTPSSIESLYAKYAGDSKTEVKFDTVVIDFALNAANLQNLLTLSEVNYMEKDTAKYNAELKADTVKDAPNHPYHDQLFADSLACAYKKLALVKDYVTSQIDYVNSNYKYAGVLEARFISGDFDFTMNFKSGSYIVRANVKPAEVKYNDGKVDEAETAKDLRRAQTDSINYFDKFEETVYTLAFSAITSKDVNFVECNENADKAYKEVKDAYDVLVNKVFTGMDYTTTVYSLDGNPKCDAATANWGSEWRIPTNEEIKELVEKCTWEFEGNGYKVTGPSGNSIFLPAAGYRYGNEVVGTGVAGYYASLGNAVGTYHYPSTDEQLDGSKGSVKAENTKNYLIFQYGQFEKSVKLYDNITTNYASSIRPVCK